MKRKPFLHQISVVDKSAIDSDGVSYTAQKKVNIVQDDSEKFFMTYAHIVGVIEGFSSITDVKVFYWVMDNMRFNQTIIVLSKFFKEQIESTMNLSMSSIEKSISNLCKCGILVRDMKNIRAAVYHVNPTYAYYGDSKERKRNLKFVLEMQQFNKNANNEKEIESDIKRFEDNYKKTK
jgi:predicted transcriptional regulator